MKNHPDQIRVVTTQTKSGWFVKTTQIKSGSNMKELVNIKMKSFLYWPCGYGG
jgi:hypothetical protein